MSDDNDPLPPLPVSKTGRILAIGLVLALTAAGVAFAAIRLSRPKPSTPKLHRAVATKCGASVRTGQRDPSLKGCQSDTECRSGSNGRCERRMVSHAHFQNRCVYDDCSTDDDCEKQDKDPLSTRLGDGPCICGEKGEVNTCYGGNCRTDADCGSSFCSRSRDFQCGYEGTPGYYCHTEDDLCLDDSDCAADAGFYPAECRYDPEAKRWACAAGQCRHY
jgi:hypothetical protein